MKRLIIFMQVLIISLYSIGKPGDSFPDLGLHGKVTWLDNTHIRVVYDWSAEDQLLDWMPVKGGTKLAIKGSSVLISGGSSDVRSMQWRQPIKCSRILSENVVTGNNGHVNFYTNIPVVFDGSWNPENILGVILRGFGNVFLINGSESSFQGDGPVPGSPDSYELVIAASVLTFKVSSTGLTSNISISGSPENDRFIALGAYGDDSSWGKITIEGEVSAPWQSQSVPADIVNIQTTGSVFSPILQVTGNPVIEWTFEDGTKSSSPSPVKDYGNPASRRNYLKVTPWSAVTGLNLGYDASDGGYSPDIALHPSQGVIGFQNFGNLKGSLKRLSMLGNPVREMDLSGFISIEFIELYNCKALEKLTLDNHPLLERICLENSNLSTLNLSGCPQLADLRAALNNFSVINWGSTGSKLWHICIRDNPLLITPLPALTQFPLLRELLIWNDNQSGTLECHSEILETIQAEFNNYDKIDVRGCKNLKRLTVSGNLFKYLDISGSPEIRELIMEKCDLSGSVVNYVLGVLDCNGIFGGKLDLSGNTAPSGSGINYLDNLRNRSWDIQIPWVPVSSIGINSQDYVTTISGDFKSLQLDATILPEEATDKRLVWSIDDGKDIAVVSQTGLVTALGNGVVSISASSQSNPSVIAYYTLTISNQVPAPKLSVYGMRLRVLPDEANTDWLITITNFSGQVIYNGRALSGFFELDLSNLKPGIYMASMYRGKEIQTRRFVIK